MGDKRFIPGVRLHLPQNGNEKEMRYKASKISCVNGVNVEKTEKKNEYDNGITSLSLLQFHFNSVPRVMF
jgi:vacuolar-type H+-ATPase subunit E/Vma4